MTNVLDQITADRVIARQAKDTNTYQILTQILGSYQTGATLKKPKVGDGVIFELIRGIVGANNETVGLLKKHNTESRYDDKILELEKQTTMLSQYLPTMLTTHELLTILADCGAINIKDYMSHLRTNYADRFKPGDAAAVFNSGS